MTPAQFLEHFAPLTDTEGGVKKLRNLILQLAVQGKLVEQDPGDEPAAILLQKIENEKAKLAAEGEIRKPPKLPSTNHNGYDVRSGWVNTLIGNCIELISGQHLKPESYNEEGNGHPYLTGPADFGPVYPTASRWTYETRAIAKKADILVTVKGAGIGKTNILGTPTAFISRQLMAARPIVVDRDFLHLVLKSTYDKFQSQGVGIAIPGIGRDEILHHEFGLPPLAEQKRIVAKVDELMRLCDQLEARQTEQWAVRVRMSAAALDRLTQAADASEFAPAWQRLNTHFDTLFARPESLAQLRQTLLQLAVMGKLVPQNPKDEPAEKQLRRIAENRKARLEAKEIGKPKPLRPIEQELSQFSVPNGWEWSRSIYDMGLQKNVVTKQLVFRFFASPTFQTVGLISPT